MENGNDLSLRHLPDLSSSSFSFEIPPESNDELLLNNDDDFFGAANDSFATPAPTRTIQEPLTVKTITPKPVASAQREFPGTLNHEKMVMTVLSNSSQSNSTRSRAEAEEHSEKPRVKIATGQKMRGTGGFDMRNEVLSTPQRMQKLRDEIKNLAETKHRSEKPIPMSDSIEKQARSSAVISGGASRLKNIVTSSSHSLLERPTFSQTIYVPSDEAAVGASENRHIDMNVISTARGGLAERLVMYSQNLAGSQELSNLRAGTVSSALTVSSPFHQISSHLPHGASPKASTRDMVPCLTLSQLSPSKTRRRSSTPEPKSLRSSDGDASPMRQSHKRPGSPVSNTQLRKKEKISTISSSSARAILPGSRAIIKRRTPSVNSNSASVMAKTKPMRHVSGPSRTTRGPPVVSKGSLGGSSIAQSHTVVHSSGTLMDSGGSSKLSVEQSEGSTKITRSHPTRPVEFNFRTNVRSEAGRPSSNAREPEDSSQRKLKHHTPYTIPNFKSSHAAQDALLTSLKGQITPVVPLPIEMHTDVRARERSKFNERVREKEAEMDRALEERKRQQAEEEERENRELRKKAIPKAHPVPDWYKDVPRRKEQRSQSGSEVDR